MQGKILSKRYLLAEEIGNGGMGSVFRATDLRTGGQVAVKIPHPFLARDPEYIERLKREAQIAASIYSPRIVRVIDLDQDDDGVLFLVMEYVPGETLLDELRARGTLPVPEVLTLGLETARALDAAHQKGIIHRDLKPHNIKLLDGEIKILDFGIAKIEGMPGVTSASVFMGTPEYSAPERAEGLGDIRSDIYSLGVILYEALAGHLPFSGLNPMVVLRKHEMEPPPPLPADIPADAVAIVMRCLAKRPEDRYQVPRDLVQDIGAALRGMPLPTPPTGEERRGLAHPILPTPPSMSPLPGSGPVDARPRPAHDEQAAGAPPVAPTVVGRMPPATGAIAAGAAVPARPAARAGAPAATPPGGIAPAAAGRAAAPAHAEPTRILRVSPPPAAEHAVEVPGAAPSGAAGRPGGRTLLYAGLGAVALAVVIAAVLLLGRGSDSAAGSGRQGGDTATPAPTTAASVPAAATSVPRQPAVAPDRPAVAATIRAGGRSGEERAVIEALNSANTAQVQAFRKADVTGLDGFFTGQALMDYQNSIGNLKRRGRFAVADLKKIELLRVTVESPTKATLQARETLDYDEFIQGSNERVPNVAYSATRVWTYQLVKKGPTWLIEDQTATAQE